MIKIMSSSLLSRDWQSDGSLALCLEGLFDTKIGSDVRFVVGERQDVVMAHRSILICRSPVFYDLLTSQKPDPVLTEWSLSVAHTSKNTFNIFLRFLYTDIVDQGMTERVTRAVISLAKEYRVNRLVSHCERLLTEIQSREPRYDSSEKVAKVDNGKQAPIGSVLQSASDNNMYLVNTAQQKMGGNKGNKSTITESRQTPQERTDHKTSDTCSRDTNESQSQHVKVETQQDYCDITESNSGVRNYNNDRTSQHRALEKSSTDHRSENDNGDQLRPIKEEIVDESFGHTDTVSRNLGVVLENLEDGSYSFPANILPDRNSSQTQHIKEEAPEETMETETQGNCTVSHSEDMETVISDNVRNRSADGGTDIILRDKEAENVYQPDDNSQVPTMVPDRRGLLELMETDQRRNIKRINQIESDEEISFQDDMDEDPDYILSDSEIETSDDENWIMEESEKFADESSSYVLTTDESHSGACEMEDLHVLKPATRKNIRPHACCYDATYPAIYTKKYMKNANLENSKSGRLYDRIHACAFCDKLLTNIQIHLEQKHQTEPEVKDIMDLKRKIDETNESLKASLYLKKRSWQKCLRNRGDNLHNQRVLASEEGEILLARRKHECAFNIQDYGPCPECEEWVILDNISRHQLTCPQLTKTGSGAACMSKGSSVIQSQIMKGKIVAGSSRLRKEVFPYMIRDDKTKVAQADRLILTLGDVWLMKHIHSKEQRKAMSSCSRMRLSAKLLLLLRKETGIAGAMSDFLCPQHFDNVVQCSLQACREGINKDLKNPSTAIKLGYDLNRLASAKLGYAIKENRECDKQEAKDFLKLLQVDWKEKVSYPTRTTLSTKHSDKKNEFPDPADIRKLVVFLVQRLKSLDLRWVTEAVYRETVVLTQARLILYNRCQPEVLESLSVEDYHTRFSANTDIDVGLQESLTAMENVLQKSRDIVEIQDGNGKCVPLLIPKEVNKTLEVLADEECRENAGIEENNKLLFACRGKAVVHADECLDEVKRRPEVGLKCPDRILVNNLRQQTATIVQALSLDEDEVKCMCNLLGKKGKVHDQYYVQISGVIDRIDIAKLMLIQELNLVEKYSDKKISEIHLNELEEQVFQELEEEEESTVEVEPEIELNEDDMVCDSMVLDFPAHDGTDPSLSYHKTPSKVIRVRWTKFEEEEIHKYFVKYFNGEIEKKCPGQNDCKEAIEKSRKEEGKIYLRNWETLKKKVSNMLMKAKKDSPETLNKGLGKDVQITAVVKHENDLQVDDCENICNNIVDYADDEEDMCPYRKKPRKGKRVTWTKCEEQEIRRYFAKYFNGEIKKRCPNKDHCWKAIELSRRQKGRIHLRNWETLKKKVANMLNCAGVEK